MRNRIGVMIAIGMTLGVGSAFAQTGNGATSGSHYNLNILGKTDCTPADLTGSDRHTIQVLLNGGQSVTDINGMPITVLDKQNKIFLQGGDDFQVLDGNACDGALFQLPTNSCYQVFARALGTPYGYANVTTCAIDNSGTPTDTSDDVVVCSMDTLKLERTKGGQKFQNVTKELTTITFVLNGAVTTVNLFDSSLYSYFWNYDNHGLRLAQLRFYPTACP